MNQKLTTRFWSKVTKTRGCWLWKGTINSHGYGQFWDSKKMRSAHRLAYILEAGEIPKTLQLDHLCRVRHCVNPAHLEPVTAKENIRRGSRRTTWVKKPPQVEVDNYSYRMVNGKKLESGIQFI